MLIEIDQPPFNTHFMTRPHKESLTHKDSSLYPLFGRRHNYDVMRAYTESNPAFIGQFADEINLGINLLNDGGLYFDPNLCPNAHQVSRILQTAPNHIQLPSFEKLFDGYNPRTQTAKGLVNRWMKRGENNDKTHGPFIEWDSRKREKPLPAEALIAGRSMDAWGVLAALYQYPEYYQIHTIEDEINIKHGVENKYFASEQIMPAAEEAMVMALLNEGRHASIVLESIKTWLGTKYGFSPDLLKLINARFGIILDKRAFSTVTQ